MPSFKPRRKQIFDLRMVQFTVQTNQALQMGQKAKTTSPKNQRNKTYGISSGLTYVCWVVFLRIMKTATTIIKTTITKAPPEAPAFTALLTCTTKRGKK